MVCNSLAIVASWLHKCVSGLMLHRLPVCISIAYDTLAKIPFFIAEVQYTLISGVCKLL